MLPHWTSNDFTADHVRLHYYRTSPEGSGKPPLVLAHGFSDDGLCWAPTARDLEDQYDVLMPDAIGHGLSQRVARGEQTDMPADLAGLLRGLRLPPAIVGGHSMGANVAAQLGARYPELVRALILEDPPWFPPVEGEARPSIFNENGPVGLWLKKLQTMDIEAIVAQERVNFPNWPDEALRAWCTAKTRLDLNILTTTDKGRESWQPYVAKIHCPVLLVTADNDKGSIVTPEVARMVTAMNSQIRVAHIPGAGHHIRFGQYEAYMVRRARLLAGACLSAEKQPIRLRKSMRQAACVPLTSKTARAKIAFVLAVFLTACDSFASPRPSAQETPARQAISNRRRNQRDTIPDRIRRKPDRDPRSLRPRGAHL